MTDPEPYSPQLRTAVVFSGAGTAGAYHAGVLRVQVNANHAQEAINGLLDALAGLKRKIPLPGPQNGLRPAA